MSPLSSSSTTNITKADHYCSMFNVSRHSPSSRSPLFINLPSLPASDVEPAPLPLFLHDQPVATINYRWATALDPDQSPWHGWPTPVHDISFAYAWLVENLAPEGLARRDMYAFGSHLGASLATSLALTETQSHARFGIRGLVAYNGIYNWSMFLPDHRVNRPQMRARKPIVASQPIPGSHIHRLQEQLPRLFDIPSRVLDPFASPALFFHSPGLLTPKSFTVSTEVLMAIDETVDPGSIAVSAFKAPRKSHFVFPPRRSVLKIPETLLLHDAPALATEEDGTSRRRRATLRGNTLAGQADELAELMRRSIDKVELKERSRWDEDIDSWEEEATRRVQTVNVGEEEGDGKVDIGLAAQEVVQGWLQERL